MNEKLYQSNNLNFVIQNEGEITILFIHGNSLSSKVYSNQFSDPLLKNYKLAAFDFPGHGESPNSTNPQDDYSIAGMASLTADFVKTNISGSVILVGYSSGGNVAIEAAPQIENLKGLVLLGTPPVGKLEDLPKAYLPGIDLEGIFFNDNLYEDKLNLFCRFCNGDVTDYDAAMKDMILKTDKTFRSTLAASVMQNKFGNEVKILEKLKVPVALLLGELDSLINLDYLRGLKIPNLYKGEVQVIKNAPHLLHYTNFTEFNKILKEFVDKITR